TGLPSGTMQSVCEDVHGIIWAVTQNGVLVCHTNNGWRDISDQTNWPGGRATCVTADHDGTVWIGTRNHALISLGDGNYRSWRTNNGFIGHVVRGMVAGSDGKLWVSEDDPGVVQQFSNGQWKQFDLPEGAGLARALAEDTEHSL